jgi:uracil-DNA glycosylase family 4
MRKRRSAADLIPDPPPLAKVRAAAKACQACDLYKPGTQTVFGEGAQKAALMLVGEQPGDRSESAKGGTVPGNANFLKKTARLIDVDQTEICN